MEGKIMERPRVPYSEIFHTIDGHEVISYTDRIQVMAIDSMVDALLLEPGIRDKFGGRTLGNRPRLTDHRNPDYGKDLFMGVHTPVEFLNEVATNYKPEINDGGMVVEDGFMHRWGERIKDMAQPSDRDRPDEAESKALLVKLLDEHGDAFKLESAPVLV